jgi:hypothetical protein
VALVAVSALALVFSHAARAAGSTYYVDCSAATDGDGSLSSPWNNLTTVNARTFAPGDSLLFARGTTCSGSFVFHSSGTSTARVTVDAYGSGPLPIIDGARQNRAVKLLDTSHVVIQNLEIANSRIWGLLATTDHDAPAVDITLRNLVVHHVTGGDYTAMGAKWTGLVVFAPGMIVEPDLTKGSGTYTRKSYFDGVLVDNVTAYDTTLWAGIFVWGAQIDQDFRWRMDSQDQSLQSRNITIQNSTVHDTYGDGIAIYMSFDSTIRTSVVYRSGMEPPPASIGSPVGLWWWSSENMLGELNESYDNHSPSVDGGGFDVDYHSHGSTMQYNYGHDNITYCISVFGYQGATTDSVVRYNVCAADGTQHTYLKEQANGQLTTETLPGTSEIYLCTWNGGKLSNTWIYNNTFYVTGTGTYNGVITDCPGGGDLETGGIWKNNLVVSAVPNIFGDVSVLDNRARDYNLYYSTVGTVADPSPEPHGIYNLDPLVNGFGYHGIGRPTTEWTLQSGSPAINAGTNPCTGLTNCTTGTRDFYGNTIPANGVFDIGANEAG